jgi:uncharacterized SAM-dependent methyltransferase
MKVEVVLTEADIAQEFVEAVEARDLPEKLFFWFPRSALAWTVLEATPELYGGLQQTWREISADAHLLTEQLGKRAPTISLGAGHGSRDLMLICALKDAGSECLYFPVDASQVMLELACAAAEDRDIETVGIKADISNPVHLVYAADAAESPRLFIISGNTAGSFDPLAQIRSLSQCLADGDRLIIDGEIYDEDLTLSLRDNPHTREFLQAMLSSIGIGPDDGEIRFEHKRDERREGLHLITRHFSARRDLTATVAGRAISVQRGERIGLNFQYAYTPHALRWLLRQQGGLEIVKEYRSPDSRFLTAVCKK